MQLFDDFLDDVNRGRLGLNYGLSTGMPKLDNLIGGVQRSTYTCIGGNTGTGKTAFADAAFVLNPYADFLRQGINKDPNKPRVSLRVFYYSFEIAAKRKIAKWVCFLMYESHGLIIDINEVYSKRNQISEEKYQLIKSCRDYIERMLEYVHIYDGATNPYGIYKEVSDYMNLNGKIIEQTKIVKGKEIKRRVFIPNDPYEIVELIEDHIGLLRGEKEIRTKKEIIDKDSENSISLRNFFGVSKVAISQFNRDLADMDRRRFTELSPQLEDFKNTGNVAEDAEIVMTLFNPLRYNIMEYGGHSNLMNFGGRYRSLSILKNRDGADMIKHNLNFMGEAGHFREFPDPYFPERHTTQAKQYTKFT